MHITRQRVIDMTSERDMSKASICRAMGVSRNYLTDYRDQLEVPIPYDKLKLAADALHTTVEYLKGETDEKERPTVSDRTLPKNAIPYNPTAVRPILGSIPAGYPSLCVQEIIGYAPVDVSDPEDCFWLLVKGNSMINAGIQPGDLVLIRTQPCADDGQIVACRVNGDEATLKRFHKQRGNVVLTPENPAYAPRIVPQADFDNGDAAIIGVAIEIKRKL